MTSSRYHTLFLERMREVERLKKRHEFTEAALELLRADADAKHMGDMYAVEIEKMHLEVSHGVNWPKVLKRFKELKNG